MREDPPGKEEPSSFVMPFFFGWTWEGREERRDKWYPGKKKKNLWKS